MGLKGWRGTFRVGVKIVENILYHNGDPIKPSIMFPVPMDITNVL